MNTTQTDQTQTPQPTNPTTRTPRTHAVNTLPKTIKTHYDAIGGIDQHGEPSGEYDYTTIEGVWSGRIGRTDTIEVQFADGTTDIWIWGLNPESRDPQRYPRTWLLRETQMPDEDDNETNDNGTNRTNKSQIVQTTQPNNPTKVPWT